MDCSYVVHVSLRISLKHAPSEYCVMFCVLLTGAPDHDVAFGTWVVDAIRVLFLVFHVVVSCSLACF